MISEKGKGVTEVRFEVLGLLHKLQCDVDFDNFSSPVFFVK